MFFDGDPRRRRNVNLGGASSRHTTKTAVVEDTRAARAQRELEIRRQRAARKIQSFYRGRTVAQEAREEVRAGFEADVKTARTNVPGAPHLLDLLRRFNFLRLADKDANARIVAFATWFASLLGPPSSINSDQLASEFNWRWYHQLKAFTGVCVEAIRREATSSEAKFDLMQACLSALLVVSDARIWPNPPSTGRQPRLLDLLGYLVEIGTYSMIRSILGMQTSDAKTDTLAVQLAFRLLDPDSPASLVQFSLSILALPTFDQLPSATLDYLRKTLPHDKLVAALASSHPVTLASDDSARLASSLASLLVDQTTSLPIATLANYLRVLRNLIHVLPRSAFAVAEGTVALASRNRDLDYDSDEDEDRMDLDRPSQPFASKFEPPFDSKLKKRLSLLLDTEFLRGISKRASGTECGTESSVQVGLFFLELMTRSKSARDQVLTVVAAHPPLMRRFWTTAQTLSLCAKFLKGQASNDEKDAMSGLIAPLAGGYSRRLVTMDDSDFTSGESRGVFALSDVVTLSASLRDVAVNLHMSMKQPGDVGDRLAALRREVSGVLLDLHDWDARRQFCLPGHWLHATVDIRADTLPLNLFDLPDEDIFAESTDVRQDRLSSSQSANIRSVQLLRYLPFVIPFADRVRLFQRLLDQDINSRINSYDQVMGSVHARVRRPYLYEDGFDRLSTETTKLKGRIRIQLIDEHGLEEAGIDGGGLFKEFLTELLKKGFDPGLGFFKETTQNLLYPNPESLAVHGPEALAHYEFLGKMVGKAVYERILVELPLAQFFLRKMLKRPCSIGDLASLDADLSRHLLYIKNYQGDFSDLALSFSVTDSTLGQTRTVDLIPNGRNVDVTRENRLQFIYLWANYRLNVSIRLQCEAFLRGMQTIIEPSWLQMFDERELQVLISGAEMPVDVEDLKRNTAYSGGYTAEHPTIRTFWNVVREFTDDQKRQLLKFATSCSRPPLLGFKELIPRFCIHSAGRESGDRLPTASTCMNLLKLPEFGDAETMRNKLIYAIEAGAGFDLS